MNDHLTPEKKKFQLERIILFSDAVIAIAITLMVLEIKIPEFKTGDTSGDIGNYFIRLIPKFIGYVVSFLMIGIYWIMHHRTFGFAINYNNRLIWINLLFLMFVALMPFSTGLYSENFDWDVGFIAYCINMIILGIFSLLLQQYISRPGMNKGLESSRVVQYYYVRSMVPILTFAIGILMCSFHNSQLSMAARYSPVLIWPGMLLVKRRFKNLKMNHE